MIFSAFQRAFAQLLDPRILRVFFLSMFLATVAVIALVISGILGIGALFDLWNAANGISLPWIGEVSWLKTLGLSGAVMTFSILGMFLFFPLVAAAASFFYEDVVDAVEAKHYPHLPSPIHRSFWAGAWETARFLGIVFLANMLAFAAGLIFPPLASLLYWAVNSYFIGREMVFVAAMRRHSKEATKALWRGHLPLFWGTAAILLIPMHVPFLNFIALVVAVAVFTHLFHSVSKA